MTAGVVIFDPAGFQARYPEFATVSTPTLNAYFGETTLYLNNSINSMVADIETRTPLLWMLVAHLAAIYSGVNGQGPSGLVGRVNNASQGTVSVATDMPAMPGSAAWYLQTPYGLSYWQATAPYRQATFVQGCVPTAPQPRVRGRWSGG